MAGMWHHTWPISTKSWTLLTQCIRRKTCLLHSFQLNWLHTCDVRGAQKSAGVSLLSHRIDSSMIIPVFSNGRLQFRKYTYCRRPPPKKKSKLCWVVRIPALRGWDSRITWKCQSSLCYIGDPCLQKEKEIWSSVDASFSQILFMQAWGLVFSHQHPHRKSGTACVPVIPARGSRRQEDAWGLLASQSGWISTLQILRVLFKIRQWEIEEDSDALPQASCTRTHTANERFQKFLSWTWISVFVCMYAKSACQTLLRSS